MYKRSIVFAVLLAAVSALTAACGPIEHPEYSTWSETQTAPPHLRVVWHEDPAHEMVVSWTTRGAQANTVYYDTEPHNGDITKYRYKVDAQIQGIYEDADPKYHHAFIEGLEPSTTYYFVVASDDKVSTEHHVITAPKDDSEFKLLYGGDSRSNRTMRREMNRRIGQLFEDDPSILAMVHGGDFVADGDMWEQWNHWLMDYQLTTTPEGRVLPILATRGNHEGRGVLFNEVFGFPGGVKRDYYRTQIGANLVWLTLDTNSSLAGEQRGWLADQLIDAQKHRWIVPSYHEPAYPAVKAPGPAHHLWVPLFEKYNVDLVAESDGHALKRTVPIRAGKADPTGVVYVGEGGLGVNQRTPKDRWYLDSPGFKGATHHVQLLTVSPEELTYEAIDIEGNLVDAYKRTPRDRG